MAKLRAYISYAPANLTFVERIAADLTARSIEAGVDRGLLATRGGSEGGWSSVRAVIDGSDVLLLIASPPAVANPDVQREIQHAVNTRKLIIPLKLRQVDLPAPVDTIQWFDFEEGRYDRDLKYLLLNLAFVTPGSPPTYDPHSQLARLPEPPESLDALFIAATSAKARNTPEDRERAAAIYASILERDPNFQNGLVQRQLDELDVQLQAQRIQNLERYAADARSTGDWPREIAALNAWGRLQGERTVAPLLAVARQNQQYANLYTQAEALAPSDPGAAGEMLRMLYQSAPKFGDPKGLATKLGVDSTDDSAPQPSANSKPISRAFQTGTSEKTVVNQPLPPRPATGDQQPAANTRPASTHDQRGHNPTQRPIASSQPPTANSPAPQAASAFPWKWYGGFAVLGIVVGWLIGGVMAAAAYDNPSCYSFDAFGNVFFICEDPTSTFIGVGVIAGLAAAYFIRRALQRS
jgi:hypothetical protein